MINRQTLTGVIMRLITQWATTRHPRDEVDTWLHNFETRILERVRLEVVPDAVRKELGAQGDRMLKEIFEEAKEDDTKGTVPLGDYVYHVAIRTAIHGSQLSLSDERTRRITGPQGDDVPAFLDNCYCGLLSWHPGREDLDDLSDAMHAIERHAKRLMKAACGGCEVGS